MNKEHFLIELKLHLRQLALVDQQAILTKYEELFNEKTEEGLTEYQITKELDSPKDIAKSILKEFNIEFQEIDNQSHDWVEFTKEDKANSQRKNYNPYYQEQEYPRTKDSGFIRFSQILGITCLNLFFMIWIIFGWAITLFVGWILTVCFIGSPFLGAFSLLTIGSAYGFFQLFMSILLCGIGFIGLLIMLPFSKVSFNLLKTYSRWNIQVLKGDRAL
ncbi:MAG: DUF1700 domain-containing protein [Vagococcus sp.]|uniref:DUF1700 domain-containing protein n=1 Tax=Vagococcus sp. TaxID=1933889 RepID=UPI002FCC9690